VITAENGRHNVLVFVHAPLCGASRSHALRAWSLTRQIRELEKSIGKQLFDRIARSLVLTETGQFNQWSVILRVNR
jgi:hypothetical protein